MTEKTAEGKETRETFTFKQREVNRAAKFIASMTRLHDACEATGMPQKALDLIETASTAVDALATKLLSNMADDFKPPAASAGSSAPEEGDTVSPKEADKVLYSKADYNAEVKAVIRHGGNAEGKGAKIFLKVKRSDGTTNTVPAAHFETV